MGNLLHFYLRDVYGLKRFFKTFQNLLTIFQMAQYVSCKDHKPGCQGYRLAEILSIFVYASGETRKG